MEEELGVSEEVHRASGRTPGLYSAEMPVGSALILPGLIAVSLFSPLKIKEAFSAYAYEILLRALKGNGGGF
ncbi:hypothetical protein AWM70_17755 [Paenibacillus yonginensis]|uniref:Uncharacterized protein n=1 Tax=Paenibacillus yonginensis TaxID=1462996 RepID=A0A1B1N454_9BACL|nr:hypothetical protein [Paenibacillus yonginensis]ANS76199.1 hypothetical protein AWM70_17755 [Paenibacillus yonginensis]